MLINKAEKNILKRKIKFRGSLKYEKVSNGALFYKLKRGVKASLRKF